MGSFLMEEYVLQLFYNHFTRLWSYNLHIEFILNYELGKEEYYGNSVKPNNKEL